MINYNNTATCEYLFASTKLLQCKTLTAVLCVIVICCNLHIIPTHPETSHYTTDNYAVFHKKRNRNQIQPILTTINSDCMKIAQSTCELLFIVITK